MEKHPVRRLKVEGWKSFRSLELTFDNCTVLIGSNGAGKSNLLSSFSLMRAVATRQLLHYWTTHGRAYQLFHYGPKHTEEIHVRFTIGERSDFIRIAPTSDPNFVADSGSLSQGVYLAGSNPDTALDKIRSDREAVRAMIQSIRLYQFHDTSTYSRFRGFADIHQTQYLHEDGGNLAAILWQMRRSHPAHYFEIERHAQAVIPGLSHFVLEPARESKDEVRLEWLGSVSDYPMTPHQLSDGSLRWIALCTLLLQPPEWAPGVILLDEPELGLHPHALERLAGLVHAASQNTQVILATQSPYLLNFFSPEQVITIDHDGRESSARRHDSASLQEWLKDYSLGELWEKNLLGGLSHA